MNSLTNRVLIFCLWCLFAGCATNPIGQEGLLTVVYGNHSVAVDHTMHWLNDHKFLVVDRWVEEELGAPHSTPGTMIKRRAHMLSIAQKVGASLVVLVEVHEKPYGTKIPSLNVDDSASKNIEVEIQGMNAETGTIEYGAQARNSPSPPESDEIIVNLTTLALQKAFQHPSHALLVRKNEHQGEKPGEQVKDYSIQGNEKTLESFPDSQPIASSPTAQPEIFDGIVQFEGEKTIGGDVSPPTTNTEKIILDSERQTSDSRGPENGTSSTNSMGLQIASGALSVLYTPIKLAYAMLGGIFGSFAYLVTAGNEEVAQTIWSSSLGGTYWLAPEHLRGDTPIHFRGQSKSTEDPLLIP